MNPAIVYLAEKGRRSLAVAEQLHDQGENDFAVSRAYYAMLYLAQAALLSRGLNFSKHSGVISAFGREFVKSGHLSTDLHKTFRFAYEQRNISDYRYNYSYPSDKAEQIIFRARAFLVAVHQLLREANAFLALGVLISGGGRTLLNLHEKIRAGELPAQISVVISSLSKVKGVERAGDAGLPVKIIRIKDYPDVEEFSRRIVETLEEAGVQLACQAGWTCYWRLPERWMGRVMNIHPALLPKFGGKGFYGHHVHEAVLAAGETESGCTVHFADNQYDAGPIILQRKLPVLPEDTPDTLADRVFEQECIAYPEAIRLFAEDRLILKGDRVEIR